MLTDEIKAGPEEMKAEAIWRMQKLELNPEIREAFSVKNKLLCSDKGKVTEVPENIKKVIKEWENKYGNIVYHVIHSDLFYETYECLSVSCYISDWWYERDLIYANWVMSHSVNIDIPEFTESGSIQILKTDGTLLRVG